MFCMYCGAQIPDDAEYCVACGQRLFTHVSSVDTISNSMPEVNQYQPSDNVKQQSVDKLLIAQIILGAVTFALLTLARFFIFVTGGGVIVMSVYSVLVGIALLIVGIVRFAKKKGNTQHKTAEIILFALTIIMFVYTMFTFIVAVSVF